VRRSPAGASGEISKGRKHPAGIRSATRVRRWHRTKPRNASPVRANRAGARKEGEQEKERERAARLSLGPWRTPLGKDEDSWIRANLACPKDTSPSLLAALEFRDSSEFRYLSLLLPRPAPCRPSPSLSLAAMHIRQCEGEGTGESMCTHVYRRVRLRC
jgi:hypothetical protein